MKAQRHSPSFRVPPSQRNKKQNLAKEVQTPADPMKQKEGLSGITDRRIGTLSRPAVEVLLSLCVGMG